MPDRRDSATIGLLKEVRRACVEAGEPDPLNEAAVLQLQNHGLDGAWLAAEDHGFALVRDGDLVLAVSPAARGAGVGARLLGRAEGADRAWSHGDHPAAAALARSHGWRRTRELWFMRRPASDPLEELVVPPELTIRSFRDSDTAALLEVNARSFAMHPEQGAMDEAELRERMAEPWFDPEGLLVVVHDDGRLLGFHWTKQHSADVGEVYVVAIEPESHGYGLGKLATLAGLHRLHSLGVSEVVLYVESDNAPAIRVYRDKLGFTHAPRDTDVQYTYG